MCSSGSWLARIGCAITLLLALGTNAFAGGRTFNLSTLVKRGGVTLRPGERLITIRTPRSTLIQRTYAAGFARGRLVYLFALTFASAVLPLLLILFYRNRRLLDLALAGGLLIGLIASLSRGLALLGPIAVVVAIAVERRISPSLIVAGVVVAFLSGILFNEVAVPYGTRPPSFAVSLHSASVMNGMIGWSSL